MSHSSTNYGPAPRSRDGRTFRLGDKVRHAWHGPTGTVVSLKPDQWPLISVDVEGGSRREYPGPDLNILAGSSHG